METIFFKEILQGKESKQLGEIMAAYFATSHDELAKSFRTAYQRHTNTATPHTTKQVKKREKTEEAFPENRNHHTFKMCNITMGHLQLLRLKLISLGWIARDTQPDDFDKLFSGKINNTRITWTKKVGKGMLLFLFQQMCKQKLISVSYGHSISKILESHFVDKDGIYISGLNNSKFSRSHFEAIKECLDTLTLEAVQY